MTEERINHIQDTGIEQSDPKTDHHKIFIINPVISCREEGTDGAILYNPDIDDFVIINGTGVLIWKYLTESHTIAEITEFLLEIFGDIPSRDEIIHDISVFMTDLTPDYLLEVVSEHC